MRIENLQVVFLGDPFAVAQPSGDDVTRKRLRQFGLTRASQVVPRAGPCDESRSLDDRLQPTMQVGATRAEQYDVDRSFGRSIKRLLKDVEQVRRDGNDAGRVRLGRVEGLDECLTQRNRIGVTTDPRIEQLTGVAQPQFGNSEVSVRWEARSMRVANRSSGRYLRIRIEEGCSAISRPVRFMTHTLASQDASPVAKHSVAFDAGVVCPRCERRSLDESFCEHCQFELPQPTTGSTTSASGSPTSSIWSLASLGVCWPDDPCATFDMILGPTGFRVRAIRPELWRDFAADVRTRQSVSLRALPPVHVLEVGGGSLVLAEAWQPNAVGLVSSSLPTLDELLVETLRWCRQLDTALSELHASGHVWLEFDPEAVEVKGELLRITNLDWRLFPHGRCPSQLARISPRYSPPEVCQFRDEFIGPRTDVFHLALSAYYRLAGLETNGFAGRGLESFGFEVPPLRVFRPDLPAGIWPVLRRALSINANNRPASTGELIQQLEREVERQTAHRLPTRQPNERVQSEPSLWQRVVRRFTSEATLESSSKLTRPAVTDVGWLTVAGRAKSALGAVNQDCVVVQHEPVRDREVLLMIVADGVTHARVGAGERASGLACEVLVASIREQIRACSAGSEPAWQSILDCACQSASDAVVTDALSIPDRPARINDNDLMSTTALIGVLDGSDLYLANVGDSRAYLVASGLAEQLTVDGDVASSQLRQGTLCGYQWRGFRSPVIFENTGGSKQPPVSPGVSRPCCLKLKSSTMKRTSNTAS